MTNLSHYEEAIRLQLAELHLGASHAVETHLNRVLAFAVDLQKIYGGDIDVITAATLLHDLGRSDARYHGAASANLSTQMAREVLSTINFAPEKTPEVLQAITEHDQPQLRPSTIEGRILKDADFLAGMGALGIARSALWTGESGGTQADLLDRLVRKMPERIASLEFPESRRRAASDYVFAALFASKLLEPPSLGLPAVPYIVLEGISGTGKSTQVGMLASRFTRNGTAPLVIHEPTPWFGQVKDSLRSSLSGGHVELALLLSDRFINVAAAIRGAMEENRPVISDRSYVSSMVYQAGEVEPTPEDIAYLHSLMPQPTSLILLDVEPDVALSRVNGRQGARGEHETLEQFIVHRQRFLSLTRVFPLMHVLKSGIEPQLIHDQVWEAVVKDMPSLCALK